jgi:lysophospholipase L1-like esterase
MLFEGVNDIGNSASNPAPQLISAFKTIIADARKANLITIGGTITPFGGSSYSGSAKEEARKTVNAWIKTAGNFDYVVDFAAAVESKSDASKLDSRYNGGDSLHPNVAGYQAMADAFPLDIFDV